MNAFSMEILYGMNVESVDETRWWGNNLLLVRKDFYRKR